MEGRFPKINVLIIDDSAVVRRTLTDIVNGDPELAVSGAAQDPFIAAVKIEERIPDVIVLDIEMPRMDGLTFLEKLMAQHPIPVVICSSQAESGQENWLRAIEYGASEIIRKPKLGAKDFLEEERILLTDAIKAAYASRGKLAARSPVRIPPPKLSADAVLAKPTRISPIETTDKLVALGASTGGTEAIRAILEALSHDAPGIVVVQHMPEHFTSSFARRLDSLCRIAVKEAENNDSVIRGRALIAPGNRHTLLKRSGTRYYVEIKDGPLVSRHRPSVDVLFRSVARYAGRNALGVIMTGMGDDGARGLLEMREAGAKTLAQDEATCIVFGMPKEAFRMKAVDKFVPLDKVAAEIMAFR
ncbi:MAG: chemotaxis response regulator protein-glutamate methylesterase [Spirochaetales bacterium]|nr:chemotaxis response regulator protein-glutamate methylesterase [Spirochaetales bacterium]